MPLLTPCLLYLSTKHLLYRQEEDGDLLASQYCNVLNDIGSTIASKETFPSKTIIKDGNGDMVDLCDWLGNVSTKKKGEYLGFPSEYGLSDGEKLADLICKAAKESGTVLRYNCDNTRNSPRIRFRCYRNNIYTDKTSVKKFPRGALYPTNVKQRIKGKQSSKSKKKHGRYKRKTNTSLPLSEECRCRMSFIVTWNLYDTNQWCIAAQDGNPHHHGHKPDLPSEKKSTIDDIGDKGREIIKNVFDAGGTASTAQFLINQETGVVISCEQIQRERQTVRHPDQASRSEKSPAQRAVDFLSKDKAKSYILMVHEVADVNEGSAYLTENTNGKRFGHAFKTLVGKGDGNPSIVAEEVAETTINNVPVRRSGRKKVLHDDDPCGGANDDPYAKKYSYSTKTIRRCEHKSTTSSTCKTFDASLSDPMVTVDATGHAPREEETKEEYCMRIRKALKVSDSQTLLLAIAWVDDEEIRKFLQYPEIAAGDDTAQTNSEARPMWVLTFKTRSNNLFTAIRAYLPSRSRFVYNWLWNEAIPQLLPEEGRHQIQLVVMDNDEREHGTFQGAISKHYPKAMRRVCGFHVITQALLSSRTSIGAPTNSSEESAAIAKHFKGWLYSWLVDGGIENEAEFVTSKRDLYEWLDSKKVKDVMGEPWCANATRFVNKSIVPYEDLILSYLFSDQASFGMYTSSIAESAHSSNKAGSQNSIGCRPCDPLDESLRKINNKAHVKMSEMLQNEAKSTILTPTWSKSNTAGKIIPEGERLLQERSVDAESMLVYRKDEFTWLCMTDPKRQKKTLSPITTYQRCYKVSYRDGCLFCTCKKYTRFGGMPCPEQVAILKTGICLEHIGVRWHSQYGYRYGREGEEDVTSKYKAALKMDLPGPVIDLHSISDYPKDAPEEEFSAVLNSPTPVVISSWRNEMNGGNINASNGTNAAATGVVGQPTSVSMGGGLKQTASLSQRNADVQMESSDEEEECGANAGACCDAFGSLMPIFESIVRAADSNPQAKEKAAEMLKNARDVVVGIAQEALGGNNTGSKYNSKVAGSAGMASSNVPGMDRSKTSIRKRALLERSRSNKKTKPT